MLQGQAAWFIRSAPVRPCTLLQKHAMVAAYEPSLSRCVIISESSWRACMHLRRHAHQATADVCCQPCCCSLTRASLRCIHFSGIAFTRHRPSAQNIGRSQSSALLTAKCTGQGWLRNEALCGRSEKTCQCAGDQAGRWPAVACRNAVHSCRGCMCSVAMRPCLHW